MLLLLLGPQVLEAAARERAQREERRGEESGSSGRQGKRGHTEIFTYSPTDFLALSGRER